jgi:ribbon-helix-helix CopG family protein
MTPNDQTFIRQRSIAQGREFQVTVKVTQPMHKAFKNLSDELGLSMSQHLRRMLRAYLAQNLIGYED